MKNIKKDKILEKKTGVELNEAQMDTVSGGFGSAIEVGTEVEVETGDINLKLGNIGLVNKSNVNADIIMNTSGQNNTSQNNGGINIGS